VRMRTRVREVRHRNGLVTEVVVDQPAGALLMPASHVISSMSIRDLVLQLEPAAPDAVREAALGLSYRAFVLVALVVDRPELFPDNWVYVHEPEVRVGRIQNAGNWSRSLVPDPATSSLGMEYFCDEGDDLWNMTDERLVALATRELVTLGLAHDAAVRDAHVIRQSRAYPVYDRSYRQRLNTIRAYLEGFQNLQTVGRNGMHRYNNMDHSMLTGMAAARRVLGQPLDVWAVNTDPGYGEAAPLGVPGA
jgi:protoporphyrinogen oxidase